MEKSNVSLIWRLSTKTLKLAPSQSMYFLQFWRNERTEQTFSQALKLPSLEKISHHCPFQMPDLWMNDSWILSNALSLKDNTPLPVHETCSFLMNNHPAWIFDKFFARDNFLKFIALIIKKLPIGYGRWCKHAHSWPFFLDQGDGR